MKVHDDRELACERIDAAGWSEEVLEREVHAGAMREPFDLASGPVLRVQFFPHGPGDIVLLADHPSHRLRRLVPRHPAEGAARSLFHGRRARPVRARPGLSGLYALPGAYAFRQRTASASRRSGRGSSAGELQELNLPAGQAEARRSGAPAAGRTRSAITGEAVPGHGSPCAPLRRNAVYLSPGVVPDPAHALHLPGGHPARHAHGRPAAQGGRIRPSAATSTPSCCGKRSGRQHLHGPAGRERARPSPMRSTTGTILSRCW